MPPEYRLTIAVCCHADTPYFEEMIDSFLHAEISWPRTEFLICDDGSPAGGDGDKARRLASRNGLPFDIHIVRHENHWRQAASLQHLRDIARGEYLLFFDSDDIFIPFDIAADLEFLDAHPEYCGTYGKKIFFSGEKGAGGTVQGGDYSAFEMLLEPPLAVNGMIVRASDLRSSWGFVLPNHAPMECGNDICMWFGCGLKKPFCFRNHFRTMYRLHTGQTTFEASLHYQNSYREFRAQARKVSADLRDMLFSGRPFPLPAERRYEMMILLGAEYADSTETEYSHQLLNIAGSIDPEDYGVREMRIRLLRREKREEEALLETFLMLGEHPDSPYISLRGYQHVTEILAGKEQAESFQRLRERASETHFALTPTQQKQMEIAVDNARRLFASGIR